MKTQKKKKKHTKQKFKIFKGFTMVELLAVIVILGIIMMIAIPSVISVMNSSKKRSFVDYATKVYVEAEKQYMEDTTNAFSGEVVETLSGGETEYTEPEDFNYLCVLYSIENFDLDNTGDYKGYVLVNSDGDTLKYYITMFNSEYMYIGIEASKIESTEPETFTSEDDSRLDPQNLFDLVGADDCSVTTGDITADGEEESEVVESTVEGNMWVAHYTNGVIDACYLKETTMYSWFGYPSFGGPEFYCAGQVDETGSSNEFEEPSTVCCTAQSGNYVVYNPLVSYTNHSGQTVTGITGLLSVSTSYTGVKVITAKGDVYYGVGTHFGAGKLSTYLFN